MAKSFKSLGHMERWHHLRENSKVCPCCNKEKWLMAFWDKDKPTEVSKFCRPCSKRKYKEDVLRVVLGVLRKNGV
jgi:hypothetical protein